MHISNGRAIIAQRFAIDLVGLDENGLAAVGEIDGTTNEDWFGFGAELIAVAEGVVRAIRIRDGVPDRSPLKSRSRFHRRFALRIGLSTRTHAL